MFVSFKQNFQSYFTCCNLMLYRKKLGRLVILCLVILIFKKCLEFTARDSSRSNLFQLSVIHINDFHARFLETGPNSGKCILKQKQYCIGGLARVSTASRKLLAERPNAIFLNAGDNFQGTFWYYLFKWNVTAEFMNRLPFDAMTIGNHDFDDGIAGLVPFLRNVKAPVVMTNINDTNEPTMKGLYQNSTIIERDGRKIGVIGVIISTMSLISKTERLEFFDEVKSVYSEANKLKSQRVDIIIVLSHCGLDIDKIMAEKCPHIDIIVGGHSNTFLYSGRKPYTDEPIEEYPVVVKQKENNRTVLIVQAAAYTRYIGNLTIWFDSRGEVLNWEGNPILLDHSIEEDPEILNALKPWMEELDEKGKAQIGRTNVFLSKRDCLSRECYMGNLITDAMVDYYRGKDDNMGYWTHAAISVINAGGIHGSISNNPGTISFEDLALVLPYGETYDLIELKGSDILKTLEKAVLVSESPTTFLGMPFVQGSGLKVTYNLSNPANSRVIDVQVRCQACEFPKYEKLVPEEWYRVVVTSFLLKGGNNHTDIQYGQRNHEPGPLDIDVIVDYVKRKSPIVINIEGRITVLGSWNKL